MEFGDIFRNGIYDVQQKILWIERFGGFGKDWMQFLNR